MKHLNNKGQTLVAFILLIPMFSLVLALCINLGYISIEKRNIENEIKSTIKYGFDNKQDVDLELELRKLIHKNIDDINDNQLVILIEENYIKINVKKAVKSLLNKDKYNFNITYKGILENNKLQIIKE